MKKIMLIVGSMREKSFNQTGIALDREAFTSDRLDLKEQEIESMQEHVKAFVAFLEA